MHLEIEIFFKMLFHLPPKTAILISSEIQRLLKPGAKVSLILPQTSRSFQCTVDYIFLWPCHWQRGQSGHYAAKFVGQPGYHIF